MAAVETKTGEGSLHTSRIPSGRNLEFFLMLFRIAASSTRGSIGGSGILNCSWLFDLPYFPLLPFLWNVGGCFQTESMEICKGSYQLFIMIDPMTQAESRESRGGGGWESPLKGLGGPGRTMMGNHKMRGSSWKGDQHGQRPRWPLVEAWCTRTVAPRARWAQTTRGASCSLPALGDSVLQPRFPDNPGKYEACKSIRKHPLFRRLLPSKSTSPKPSQGVGTGQCQALGATASSGAPPSRKPTPFSGPAGCRAGAG